MDLRHAGDSPRLLAVISASSSRASALDDMPARLGHHEPVPRRAQLITAARESSAATSSVSGSTSSTARSLGPSEFAVTPMHHLEPCRLGGTRGHVVAGIEAEADATDGDDASPTIDPLELVA